MMVVMMTSLPAADCSTSLPLRRKKLDRRIDRLSDYLLSLSPPSERSEWQRYCFCSVCVSVRIGC